MALFGDDCYFYYYSSCNKGEVCPYRHVPEARGNETCCTLWKAGHCSRPSCRFRHMEITVDRSNIPCYWETQPSGCAKPHCPFKHYAEKQEIIQEAERCVVPPVMKGVIRNIERSTPSPTNQYSRSSPKIDPVVVNPISDDSDEGSPLKKPQQKAVEANRLNEVSLTRTKIISTKKNTTDGENAPSLKIKTLQEIRREKEMLQIINDSLEKPLEDDFEAYTGVNISTSPTRKIVLDEPSKENNKVTKTVSEKSSPVLKGNVKSRLGRKLGDKKESEDKIPTQPKSLASRLGISSLPMTKDTKDDVAEIKIKSLEEIKLEKSKEKDHQQTAKKGIRRITMVDDDSKPVGNAKSLKVSDIRKKRTIEALKTQNEQEERKSSGGAIKRNIALTQEKQKQTKLEQAIYVPPGKKNTEKNSEVSPTKKIHLAINTEKSGDTAKVRVKTFAELMAEKRKKKEMEEASQTKADENIPKKSLKSNFTPIVFDIDQKERMAAPKVVAATLPFRHKKSALVAPLSKKTEIQSKVLKTQIVKPVVAQNVSPSKESKSLKEVPKVLSSTSEPSDKIMEQTVNKDKQTNLTDIKTAKNDSSPVSEMNVLTSTYESQEKQVEVVEADSISNKELCKESDTEVNQSKEMSSTMMSAEVLKECAPKECNLTPLPVKRKSSSLGSESDKKKLRQSLTLTEDEALLFEDEDDNNFTLSSEKFDNDDDADILGDIDALLA